MAGIISNIIVFVAGMILGVFLMLYFTRRKNRNTGGLINDAPVLALKSKKAHKPFFKILRKK